MEIDFTAIRCSVNGRWRACVTLDGTKYVCMIASYEDEYRARDAAKAMADALAQRMRAALSAGNFTKEA